METDINNMVYSGLENRCCDCICSNCDSGVMMALYSVRFKGVDGVREDPRLGPLLEVGLEKGLYKMNDVNTNQREYERVFVR